MTRSARHLIVPALLVLGLAALTGCTTPTGTPASPDPEVVVPAEINPDLDLASLLPAIEEFSFPSGSAADSDSVLDVTDQLPAYGSPGAEFDVRSCDNVGRPPFWPVVEQSLGRIYRDGTGEFIANAAVTTFVDDDAASLALEDLKHQLDYCAEHASEEIYGVDETLVMSEEDNVYGAILNNSVGEEIRYSDVGPYFVYVRVVAPSTADDALALMHEIQRRIAAG